MRILENWSAAGSCSLLIFLLFLTGTSAAFGHTPETLLTGDRQAFHEPKKIIEIYLKAVRNGELVLFDKTLDESMLIPTKVEYVYELDSPEPAISVYSKLKESMPVPGHPGCKLRALSSTLDGDGHIVETEVHIWQE